MTTELREQPVLISGRWRSANKSGFFQARNPRTKEPLTDSFPISTWSDCDEAIQAAAAAAEVLRHLPSEQLAQFLECFAERIESRVDDLVICAHHETGLPAAPRLRDVELPRTVMQLRHAAHAAREESWRLATLDVAANIRSWYAPLGPIAVFGPNNFPFAFVSASGGDFAAAIAAGNPVLAKANTSHPATTRLFAEEAHAAVIATGLPAATVQLLYRLAHADGARLVADPRLGATAYTGSRSAGLALKSSADRAGKPIYLELSSINPVVILPGALAVRGESIAEEFSGSCLLGTGQFCTNPGLVLLIRGPHSEEFVSAVVSRFNAAPVGTLLSEQVQQSLQHSVTQLEAAGAERLTADRLTAASQASGTGYCQPNTLLRISGARFLEAPESFQVEAFGNASLIVLCTDANELIGVLAQLEGNLTGSIYSDLDGADDELYAQVSGQLRPKVGRLLNDKMPTGVAVSPAMNHGGPYPASGHPGFTAVGIPASLRRFAMLQCYDNVRASRLPQGLRDGRPAEGMWRLIDGRWTREEVKSH